MLSQRSVLRPVKGGCGWSIAMHASSLSGQARVGICRTCAQARGLIYTYTRLVFMTFPNKHLHDTATTSIWYEVRGGGG